MTTPALICHFDHSIQTEGSGHAIILGASGVIGWCLVDQLLSSYTRTGSFSKVTAVTNRPLKLSEPHWPENTSTRPDLQLVSGIDLLHGNGADLAKSLFQRLKDVGSVTHIFYLGSYEDGIHFCNTHADDIIV
jgi:hypothetical protein